MGLGIVATLLAPEPKLRDNLENSSSLNLKDGIFLLSIGLLVAGLLGGAIAGFIPLPVFYWVVAALLVGWIAISCLAPKRRLDVQQSSPQSLQDAVILPFQEFFQRFGLSQGSLILVFILLYKLGDSLVGITGNLFLREISFSKTEIGAVQGLSLIHI